MGITVRVTVQYFALLREQRGLDEESLETDAADPGALYAELRRAHGFSLGSESLKVAVNDDFADWRTRLADGDRVVFLPPVAGG